MPESTFHGTTVLSVREGNQVVMGADGQVTLQNTVMKSNARKVRRVYHNQVLVGFAGATADAFTLFEKFEARLETYNGNLVRAAVELAKDWRTDRMLRHLEALLMAASVEHSLLISGNGDVIEPEQGMMAIGSGGMYALAAAKGLRHHGHLPLTEVVETALTIAASIDIYTNASLIIESLTPPAPSP